ncbi:MAG: carbon-nitrogen hydrolase family protein, partial [Bacillota bacterium]|nr:carbon-nitrogen hydrolase family protein [Bacillota bacterium]
MKIMVVQPAYPRTQPEVWQAIQFIYAALDTLSPGIDLVILPECANAPGIEDKDEVMAMIGQTTPELLYKARIAARRTHATIATSILSCKPDGLHNHTLIIDGGGQIAADCEKAHLTLYERNNWNVTTPYLHGEHQPVFFEVAGVRCACVTCFDIYFPEYFSRLGASHVELILHPSYQRGELSERIRTICAARALDSGACLVHASYSMGDGSLTGGHSLAAAADGTILHDI